MDSTIDYSEFFPLRILSIMGVTELIPIWSNWFQFEKRYFIKFNRIGFRLCPGQIVTILFLIIGTKFKCTNTHKSKVAK